MLGHRRMALVARLGAVALGLGVPASAARFSESRIYIEYNASGNDLGFHVFLDGQNWRSLRILNPAEDSIFEVEGWAAYRELGMTELFFEGAEPSLDEVPLDQLLARFPEGRYKFIGETVAGARIAGAALLTHAIPAGPEVSAHAHGHSVVIRWDPVTAPPPGFPDRAIDIVGYQVIVGAFQVTLPASSREIRLPKEFVQSLERGEQLFEVLAIESGGNQTLTEGSFELR